MLSALSWFFLAVPGHEFDSDAVSGNSRSDSDMDEGMDGSPRKTASRQRRGSRVSGIDSLLSSDMAARKATALVDECNEERPMVSASSAGESQRLRKLIEK